MKKFSIIIYILFTATAFTQAQKMTLALGFGPAVYNVKSANNTEFLNSYNTLYSTTLKKPFSTSIAAPKGWQGVFSFCLGKKGLYYSNITVNNVYSDNRATFINNDQRRIQFQYNDINVDIGTGFRIGKKITVGLLAGMCIRNSYIKSSFIYNDGTESFTNEKQLNGIYHSLNILTYLGPSIDFQIHKRMSLNVKADFIMGATATSSEYYDGDLTKSNINGITSLPQDVSKINVIGYKGLSDDTKGMHFALTLKYLLIDKNY